MDWQTYIETAFAREQAAGRMTRQETETLHRQLDRLAFNMTLAAQTGEIPRAMAATWLLHTSRRRLRKYPEASPGEQAEAARWWVLGAAAGLLRESEQSIAFAEPALQEYFCLHYCQTHPLDEMLQRAARESFSAIWRRWAEQESDLIDRPLDVLRGTARAQVRAGAALVLGYIGNLSVVEALIGALGDTSDAVSLRAAQALLMLGDLRAVEPLTALLRHEAYSVRIQMVHLLEAFGDPRAVEPLMGLFNDPVLEVRFRAAQAIEKLTDMPPVYGVIAALNAAPFNMPLASTWIARALEDVHFSRLVLARLIGQRPEVCLTMVAALGRCGAPAVPVLTGMLWQYPNWRVISASIRALSATGAPQAVEPLVRMARGYDLRLARQAVQALGRLGHQHALESLWRIQRHPPPAGRLLLDDINAAIAELSKHLNQRQEDAP